MRIEPRPAFPPASASLRRAKQKNFLYIFLIAPLQKFFQLRKRKFFCFAFLLRDELRKRFPTPLSAFGGLASGQKFLPPDPLPFCPPAWASPRFFLAGNHKRVAGGLSNAYFISNIFLLPSKSNDHLFSISLPTKTWSLFEAIALTTKSPKSSKINLTEYIKVCFGIPS